MADRSYVVDGLTLSAGNTSSEQVRDLQRDLRALGYGSGPVDGVFGSHTTAAVKALQHDLLQSGSGSGPDGTAPVAVGSYNKGRVASVTGTLDQGLAQCLAEMLDDAGFPQLPESNNAAADNAAAIASIRALTSCDVPIPFLLAVFEQESGSQHFHVPSAANHDAFVSIGLDRNNAAAPYAITSRGYGIGQYTLFHHPPTPDEMNSVVLDPVKNASRAIKELREKFDRFVLGKTPEAVADDRVAEAGRVPLRLCKYAADDAHYMQGCVQCMADAGSSDIKAGETPVYEGSTTKYDKTQYHVGSYQNVPVRANIGCDWPYAVRRYNGGGVNSYDYQAEVLCRVARQHP